jgi:hypothetical protein
MHIAIDAHSIGTGLAGNETYITNLVEALADIDPMNRYTLYVTKREGVERFSNRWPQVTVRPCRILRSYVFPFLSSPSCGSAPSIFFMCNSLQRFRLVLW